LTNTAQSFSIRQVVSYVPLWTKSNFSFLEGASHPDELVEQAHRLALPALGLCDRDGVYGLVRAYTKAKELGIKLLYGAQLSIGNLENFMDPTDIAEPKVIAYPRNRRGYADLCQLISRGRQRCPKGQSLVNRDELASAGQDLLVLSPCPATLESLAPDFDDRLYGLVAVTGARGTS